LGGTVSSAISAPAALLGQESLAALNAGQLINPVPRPGPATAGVKRQYLGSAGKVANGIDTVHLSYVRDKTGHALIGARQWICYPSWPACGPEVSCRCNRAGVSPDSGGITSEDRLTTEDKHGLTTLFWGNHQTCVRIHAGP